MLRSIENDSCFKTFFFVCISTKTLYVAFDISDVSSDYVFWELRKHSFLCLYIMLKLRRVSLKETEELHSLLYSLNK